MELACKIGGYSEVDSVNYLIKGQSLHDGLRRVEKDASVLEMGQLAMKYKTIDLYVKHDNNDLIGTKLPSVQPQEQMTSNDNNNKPQPQTHTSKPKLTPKRAPHVTVPMRTSPRFQKATVQAQEVENHPLWSPFAINQKRQGNMLTQNQTPQNHPSFSQPIPLKVVNTEGTQEDSFLRDYEWEDPRTESPIRFSYLIDQLSEDEDEDEDDPLFEPETDSGKDQNLDSNCELEDDLVGEDFVDYETQVEKLAADEDVVGASDNNDEEFVEARKSVKSCTKYVEGNLATQKAKETQVGNVREVTGYDSEYYESADDLETPPDSGNEIEGGRRSRRGLLVGLDTDFRTFEWKVGQRFTTRDAFKSVVARLPI
ncbi:Protein DEHYDRATION-INDUCED 19-like protein 4 [Bienertia sinuspersici]